MAKMLAEVIVSQLADAYGELYEEKREIQEELDALKDKIAQLGGDVIGNHWGVRISRSLQTRYPGLVPWMQCHRPVQLSEFAVYSHFQRTSIRDLTKVKKSCS